MQTPTLKIKGKVFVHGEVKLLTALHIGGAAAGIDIGGVENPVIRDPLTKEPYIPGSSLRGKMRGLLERHLGLSFNHVIQQVRIHQCTDRQHYLDCPSCHLFGITPQGARQNWPCLPSRLIVRDVHLKAETKERLLQAQTELPFTEVKWEAAIDRITASAVPRPVERVPAGSTFAPFETIYTIFEMENLDVAQEVDRLRYLFLAMHLLEDDYLGGHGSRGSGKIVFEKLRITLKTPRHYVEDLAAVKLAEADRLSDLKVDTFVSTIRQHLAG